MTGARSSHGRKNSSTTDSAITITPQTCRRRHRAQHRVVRREVPDRRDVLGRLQRVGGIEVGVLEEVAAHLRREEDDRREHDQEDDDADDVLDRVVRMERNAVERLAVGGSLAFLISMPSGLFEPTSCRAMMCTATRQSSTSGTAITWNAKKRFSVTSEM